MGVRYLQQRLGQSVGKARRNLQSLWKLGRPYHEVHYNGVFE
ncbi:hypothetical protein SAMN05216202_3341 [Pseudomonas mucidolens]|uniref:Uncharacterized protein n=1 Tax=Pseudomonas mucidolens TaxID=46679 RepID=A0A1H2NB59_9PSED|nr:hypothetical protein SAMN05216202_3341 [Pseudomonas mucidolens]SQH32307.1 Uncharacterised protein [Pseudomonas mucidolens]